MKSPPKRSSISPTPTTSPPGSRSCRQNDLSGQDLGERKLGPGIYRYNASALLTGPLTLDAEGDPNAQFVFEIGSPLTTESASSVLLVNGASPCNVYWQVGSSADARHHHRLSGDPDGADLDLAQQTGRRCWGGCWPATARSA